MARFAKGTAIRITADITDYENQYVTPDERPHITISHGSTVEVSALDMDIATSPGRYYYIWQSSVNDAPGKYEVKVSATRNGYVSIEHDERAFYLY